MNKEKDDAANIVSGLFRAGEGSTPTMQTLAHLTKNLQQQILPGPSSEATDKPARLSFGLGRCDLQRCRGCDRWYSMEDFDAVVIVGGDDMVRASAFTTCRDCRLCLERQTRRMTASRRRDVFEEALIG